jgi:apolipoprotein N-acyltransferase
MLLRMLFSDLQYKLSIYCIVSGLLTVIAFPAICLSLVIWVSFVPLIYVILNKQSKHSFIYGLLSGLMFNIVGLYWILPTLKLYIGFSKACILSCMLWIYVSLYWGVWCLTVKIFSKIITYNFNFIIASSCLWVLLEYLRTYLLTGFPWLLIGYSQFKFLSIIQIVEFTGVYGVSFLILFVNFCCYFFLITNKSINSLIKNNLITKNQYIITSFIIIVIIFMIGKIRLYKFKYFGKDNLNVAIIQPNIAQYKKLDSTYINEILLKLSQYASKISKKKCILAIWPETVIPTCIPKNIYILHRIKHILSITRCPNLIGTVYNNRNEEQFNAIVVINKTNIVLLHKKHHLIPFGEYFPLKLTFLIKMFMPLNRSDNFIKGTDTNIFKYNNICLGTLICSENFFPDIARCFVLCGAKILTNHANDAWFCKTSALYQHFIMNIFRAVENRKVVVISSNSGISGIIDISGRIIKQTLVEKDALIIDTVMQNDFKTIYTKYGDIFIKICFVFLLVIYLIYYPYV